MTQVVDSRLLFVDSQSVRGTGKEFEVFVDSSKIRTYNDKQRLRVTLQSCSGYRSFPHVNNTNSEFIVRISDQAVGLYDPSEEFTVNLIHGDYPNIQVLAEAFMIRLQNVINNYITALGLPGGPVSLTNETVSDIDLTQIVSKQLHITGTIPTDIKRISVIFPRRGAKNNILDTHHLLGGRTSLDNSNPIEGLDIEIGHSGVLHVKSFYAMHTSTMSHVFLRTNLMNNNLASHGFEAGSTNTHDPHTHGSDILGRITVHDQFLYYDEGRSGSVYSAILPNPRLNSIKFTITDQYGRLIPSADSQQAEIGNCQFNVILKFDLIEYTL